MYLNCKALLMVAAFMISASALGPIIELPLDFDNKSPWKQLAGLGLSNLTETDCQRTCVAKESPRVCLYTFILEYYVAMGTACGDCSKGVTEDCFRPQCIPGDGYMRGVMSINRKLPGPGIHVCKNDLIVVNVQNRMPGTSVTIHWHGISQRHNPWMDGVPFLTQCPFSGTFTYAFPAEEAGTFFYHSHTGFQRTNGDHGALVIRTPQSTEAWSTETYDFDLPEHTIVISDWIHYTAEMFYPGVPTTLPGAVPSTILINGLGRYFNGTDTDQSFESPHPMATFHVKRNQRYRFRIINANSMICPVLIQIEGHNMTLIATDGRPIEPVVIDGLVSYAGERYDVVIDTCNVTPNKNSFWIHFRGLNTCEVDLKLTQYAVLSYGTSVGQLGIIPDGDRPTMENPLPNNTIVNQSTVKCGVNPKTLCVSDLRALGRNKEADILTAEPDLRLFIPFGFRRYFDLDKFHKEGHYRRYMNLKQQNIRSAYMNDISFSFPETPSLFLRDTVDPELCSLENLPVNCKNDDGSKTPYCQCPQFITVKENAIVEMTLVNADIDTETAVDHPIHLHGTGFYVIEVNHDSTRTEAYTSDEVQKILIEHANQASNRSHFIPAVKDTVSVPIKGFVTVRWRADNPGDWLMHCHFEWHTTIGMMMAFRVLGNIPPKPPGFPTCRNFKPLLLSDE